MSAPTLTREEFAGLVNHHTATAKKLAFTGDEVVRFADERVASAAALLAAYDALAAERDELREIAALWNAGCGCSAEEHAKLEAERDAALARAAKAEEYRQRLRMEIVGSLTEAGIYMLVGPDDPTGPGEVPSAIRRLAAERDEWKRRAEERECCRGEMAVSFASVAAKLAAMTERATKAEEERDNAAGLLDVVCPTCGPCPGKFTDEDGCCKTCGEQAFFRLVGHPKDPRIEAWRGLDAGEREVMSNLLRGWAEDARSSWPTQAGCNAAAAALEALAEGGE